jgi:anaerobic selenocysteine-containing dehydrogenase
MGLSLSLRPRSLSPDHGASDSYAVDMSSPPTADELLEVLAGHGRVPLAEVKRHLSGASLIEPAPIVLPKQPGWQGRFDLANTDMLTDLEGELRDDSRRRPGGPASGSSFRLISIRQQHMNNTTLNDAATNRGRFYNPAFMHPADMRRLGIACGDVVEIATPTAAVRAIAEPDADLLEGLVAMAFGYGGGPDRDEEFRRTGTSPGRLLDGGDLADRYVGMPRIGGVEVRVRRWG